MSLLGVMFWQCGEEGQYRNHMQGRCVSLVVVSFCFLSFACGEDVCVSYTVHGTMAAPRMVGAKR